MGHGVWWAAAAAAVAAATEAATAEVAAAASARTTAAAARITVWAARTAAAAAAAGGGGGGSGGGGGVPVRALGAPLVRGGVTGAVRVPLLLPLLLAADGPPALLTGALRLLLLVLGGEKTL